MLKTVNEKLANYIKSNGINQKIIAEKTGIPYHKLNDMIRGVTKCPSEYLFVIADALNVDANIFKPDNPNISDGIELK